MNILQDIIHWRWLARLIGKLLLLRRSRWVPPFGGVLFTLILLPGLGVVDYFFATTTVHPYMDWNKSWKHNVGDWINIWAILTIFAIYVMLWILMWFTQARSRMVVEKFVNYVGDDFAAAANGASMMLLVKLGQIHDLYHAVDEQRAVPTAAMDQSIPLERYAAIDAAIDVDTIETFLKDAVSNQSTLSVGPLQIPIGILLSFIGHVAQGPRIIGSFHKDKNLAGQDVLILTAQATRKGKAFTWRVERPLTSASPFSLNLTDMIGEFACRIFTDMTLRSTVRWRAAGSFAEGLRAYRECLRTPKDRIGNLKMAEDKFIEALAEDTQYTLVHYNMGVVLTELQRKDAAAKAFERAIHENPRSCQAYYALALSCYQDNQFYRTAQLCKRVIELKPDPASMAKAYQLRTMALLELEKIPNAISNCRKALKYAHKALRRAEIKQEDDGTGNYVKIAQAETLLGVCLSSMAKIYLPDLLSSNQTLDQVNIPHYTFHTLIPFVTARWKLIKAKGLLKTAAKLTSTDASYDALYHWELGRIYYVEGNYEKAAQHSRTAIRSAPDHIQYLADLIFNQAHALAASKKRSPNITVDEHYEDFLFQTLLDLTFAEKNAIALPALTTAHAAYTQTVYDEAKYQEKHQRASVIQAFLQLGCELTTQNEQECRDRYNTCLQDCYQSNATPVTYCAHHAHCDECTHMPAHNQQNINITNGQINQTLCLSQMVLALGRRQLSETKPSLDELDKLQQLLATFEKERSICTLLNNYDAQKRSETNQPGYEWERGRILSILATLYSEIGNQKKEIQGVPDSALFEKAACYYHNAIELLLNEIPENGFLQKKYPRSISAQNLRSSLTLALLELPNKQQEALKVAQETIFLDALNYKNYETLGEVYFHCHNYSDAIEAWKEAVARKNTTAVEVNDPDLYMKLGNAYVALAQSRHGICLDDQQCQEAVRYLEHALKCCTHEHVLESLKIYCSLGYLHCTREDYEQAIKYLRLTQSFGFAPYTSTFYRAYAHLRKRDYDAAYQQFCHLEEQLEQNKPSLPTDPGEILEADNCGHICVHEMKALALWGQAYTLAIRDVYPQDLLDKAERACALAKEVPGGKLQFPSRYLHCKGWILYKLETLEISNVSSNAQTAKREEAIEILRTAAELEAQPEIYLHLAQACQHKLTHLRYLSEKQQLLTNIRTYCQHASELNGDDDKALSQQIDDLLKSLPA